jgi:hypothetical protein
MADATSALRLADVTRFWCPPTADYAVDPDGFLTDPESQGFGGGSRNPNAVPTGSLAAHRCAVLLGEPGVGKSRVLTETGALAANVDDVVRIDLAGYGSESRLIREVFEHADITRWSAGDGSLALVLDSFDEAQRRVPTLGSIARAYLTGYPCERLYLRVACRTAEWPRTLARALADRFGATDVQTMELLPLRRDDVAHLLPASVDLPAFLAAVDAAHAGPLAARPLTLRMLVGAYVAEGALPDRGADLYERGSLVLCGEHSDDRRDTGLTGELTATQRLVVASRVAACTTFGARPSVSRVAVGAVTEDRDLPADDVVGGSEPHPMGAVAVDHAAVRETLETGLFTGSGDGHLGWTHATFPDFLAARWVLSNGLTDQQVQSLTVAADGRLFPQVRRVAAWLVAIKPERFAWLTSLDPQSFLSEIDVPDPALRHRIVERLFELAEAGRLHDEFGTSFRGLAHPGLAEQIRPRVQGSGDVQRLAINIGSHCAVTDVLPDLVNVAFDHTVVERHRVAAAWAVHELTAEAPVDDLAPLARDSAARGPDEYDELLGAALVTSWPHAIPTAEAFTLVHAQHPRNFHGLLALFLGRLAGALTADDVTPAVRWLAQLLDVDDERLAPLVRGVVVLALQHLDDPEACAAIVALARRRAADYQPLVPDELGEPGVVLPPEVRRRLALELLAGQEEDEESRILFQLTESMGGHGLGLIRSDDLPWLIDTYAAHPTLRRSLGRAAQWVVRLGDLDHATLLLELPADHPFVVDVAAAWMAPVRLDSPDAIDLRKQWQLVTRRRTAKNRTRADRDVRRMLREDLAALRAGDVERLWRVARLLSVRPGTRFYSNEFQPDLTQHPRWAELSNDARDAIVDAADGYLRSAACVPEKWLGTSTRYYPAQAGYQALLLLLRLRPDALTSLEGVVWREWAPILVDWPVTINGAQWEDKQVLLTLARPHAEQQLVDAIVTVVAAAVASDDHVFVRDECAFLWSDALAERLLDVADSSGAIKLKPLGDLLPLLATHSPDKVRPLLLDWLTPAAAGDRERALMAGRLLMRHDAEAAWEPLRERFAAEPAFGDEVLLGYGAAHDRTPPQLSPQRLAELYLWLVERFPPTEDPDEEDVHWVGPREALGHWRDAILDHLRALGTPDGVDAVRMVAAARPDIPWLARTVVTAEDALRTSLWQPVSPPELVRLAAEPRTRLVYDEAALLRLVREGFKDIQRRLQGQTPEAHLLWDTVARRPKSEDEISLYLRNRLTDRLAERGVVVNREVQVRPTSRSGVGERTDLHIDAVTQATTTGPPTITIVGEVKGAWNPEGETAMQSQLLDRYMRDTGSRHGIFVALLLFPWA